PLLEARWIPDEVETIAATFRELSARFEVVFSSGGVGPTHDDVTFAGLARAFGVPLVRHPELAREIHAFYGDKVNESLLRMADLPEGTELVREPGLVIPVTLVRNVYVFPGVPKFFQAKFRAIRERFRRAPFHLRKLYTSLDEGDIATALEEAERRFAIAIGSYPRYDGADYQVLVTLEAKDRDAVEKALEHLLARIPKDAVVRVE
ncbi:MAG TPA: molybdopterin-binding protein, partial [Planctomycetota bacterium]|nr:molybdopterin-binding protein [Planctomycetota bacterium]